MSAPIRQRDRDQLLVALKAGVAPQQGLQHIQVGRSKELEAILGDIARLSDGGASFRMIVGDYGSGKTFFLSMIRTIAQEKKFVTAHADLNPDRRLHSTGGHARSLYMELIKNCGVRSKPEGGAITTIVEKFISSAIEEGQNTGSKTDLVIKKRMTSISELVGGFDFATVIGKYFEAHETGNDEQKNNVIRWLRGEFTTKTDARAALGVRTIVDDENVYDQLKLFARFVKLAGFSGFLVCLDEVVNLYKMANTRARNSNYEQILRILNDSLQGSSVGLGVILGGTPDLLLDVRKGLYSYQALQSRLAENPYKKEGQSDFSGPVIRLSSLTPEDLFILLQKLRHVYASGDPNSYLVTDDQIKKFLDNCSKRIGDAYFKTPRQTIVAFLHLMSLLDQHRETKFEAIIPQISIEADGGPDMTSIDDGDSDDLKSFKL